MTKNRLIILLIYLLSFNTLLFAADTLVFSSIKNSQQTIISTLVMQEAYKRLNIEIVVDEYPSKRTIIIANEGETDGELFRIDGMDSVYKNLIKVPIPINKFDAMLYTKKTNIKVEGWQSLVDLKLGIRAGIVFSEIGTKGMDTYVFNSNQKLFEILEADRVDGVVLTRLNGLEELEKMQSTKIKAIEPPIEQHLLYHYLHKKNKHLLARLTKVLKQMQKEGLIEKIRSDFLKKRFSL